MKAWGDVARNKVLKQVNKAKEALRVVDQGEQELTSPTGGAGRCSIGQTFDKMHKSVRLDHNSRRCAMGWSWEANVIREGWVQKSESTECVVSAGGKTTALEEFCGSGEMTRRGKTGDTCE